jgi:hypothetical protein
MGNSLYAVQFANQGLWEEETGLNILSETFIVDADGAGRPGEGGLKREGMEVVEFESKSE